MAKAWRSYARCSRGKYFHATACRPDFAQPEGFMHRSIITSWIHSEFGLERGVIAAARNLCSRRLSLILLEPTKRAKHQYVSAKAGDQSDVSSLDSNADVSRHSLNAFLCPEAVQSDPNFLPFFLSTSVFTIGA